MAITVVRDNDINDDGTGNTGSLHDADWKDQIYDRIDEALAKLQAACALRATVGQSIPSATHTAVLFNTELTDPHDFHSTTVNTSRITIPAGFAGDYEFSFIGTFMAGTAGQRIASYRKNGAIVGPSDYVFTATAAFAVSVAVSARFDGLVAGDYLEVFVYQDSGAPLDFGTTTDLQETQFRARRVG